MCLLVTRGRAQCKRNQHSHIWVGQREARHSHTHAMKHSAASTATTTHACPLATAPATASTDTAPKHKLAPTYKRPAQMNNPIYPPYMLSSLHLFIPSICQKAVPSPRKQQPNMDEQQTTTHNQQFQKEKLRKYVQRKKKRQLKSTAVDGRN